MAVDDEREILDRFGHISPLVMERLCAQELEGAALEAATAHLRACARCQAQRAQLEALVAPSMPAALSRLTLPQAAPATPQVTRPAHASLWSRLGAKRALSLLAMSAGAALLLWWGAAGLSQPQPDQGAQPVIEPAGMQDRVKGDQLIRLEVFVHDGQAARQAQADEVVHPGDRLGFKLYTWRRGYVWLIGLDERREVYAGYPQTPRLSAPLLEATPEGMSLQEALRLDDVLGQERIIAFLCQEPLSFEQIKAVALAYAERPSPSQEIDPRCTHHSVTLHKKAR